MDEVLIYMAGPRLLQLVLKKLSLLRFPWSYGECRDLHVKGSILILRSITEGIPQHGAFT
jgi:hypothetical protein